jgi:hypothetical protein
MASVRIRWRGVARAAAIVVVALIALRVVPSLLRAPEPPPLGRDVGLPRAKVAPVEPAREATKPPAKRHRAKRRKEPSAPAKRKRKSRRRATTRAIPDAPAATAVIGTRRHRRVHRHRNRSRKPDRPKPTPEPDESTVSAVPEYVPPPPSETSPPSAPELPAMRPPAPATTPGDGSQEFAPH